MRSKASRIEDCDVLAPNTPSTLYLLELPTRPRECKHTREDAWDWYTTPLMVVMRNDCKRILQAEWFCIGCLRSQRIGNKV